MSKLQKCNILRLLEYFRTVARENKLQIKKPNPTYHKRCHDSKTLFNSSLIKKNIKSVMVYRTWSRNLCM